MSPVQQLKKKLDEIISQESSKSIEVLSSYIVGEFLGNYDHKYDGIYETSPTAQRIGDLAADLEISNGSTEQLQESWKQIKELVNQLDK